MPLTDHLLELGIELASRLSSQERALANARSATTALSRARVERDAVELYLADLAELDGQPQEQDHERSHASG